MAVFKKLDKTKIDIKYGNNIIGPSICYEVNGQITEEDVKKINTLRTPTILILKNTKGQKSEILKQITAPSVSISVLGGLDYTKIKKYADDEYIRRTIYPPRVLAKIIEYLNQIEKGINPHWNESQKAMYVYGKLAEQLHYKYKEESSYEEFRDVTRSLEGILYGKMVCVGFSLLFKEMMDRIGIECIYQNKICHHAWNIVKLDGKYIGVDLTFDCNRKNSENQCLFTAFGRDASFYEGGAHDISKELEEKKYDLSVIPLLDLEKNLKIINSERNLRGIIIEIYPAQDKNGNVLHYINLKSTNSRFACYIKCKEYEEMVVLNEKIENELKSKTISQIINESRLNSEYSNITNEIRIYKRNDGSAFCILKGPASKGGVNEYFYFEFINDLQDSKKIKGRREILFSEMDLLNGSNEIIADVLLSRKRLENKIQHFKGYVGYVSTENKLVYNSTFEEQELGIRRKI